MFRCPACKSCFSRTTIEGYTTKVRVSIEVDEEGIVQKTGPMIVQQTVRAGEELEGLDIVIVCPSCQKTLPKEEYTIVLPCQFTREESSGTYKVPLQQLAVLSNLANKTLTMNVSDRGHEIAKDLLEFDVDTYFVRQ